MPRKNISSMYMKTPSLDIAKLPDILSYANLSFTGLKVYRHCSLCICYVISLQKVDICCLPVHLKILWHGEDNSAGDSESSKKEMKTEEQMGR